MEESNETDGRNLRSQRNRERTIQALLDLVLETGENPSIEALADRAGVSRRSVFRLFENRDTLLTEASQAMQRRLERLYPAPEPLPGEAFESGLERFVAHCLAMYQYVDPMRLLIEQQDLGRTQGSDPYLSPHRERFRELERLHVRHYFAVWLEERADVADLIELILFNTGWHAWHALRRVHELTPEAIGRLLVRQITALLY